MAELSRTEKKQLKRRIITQSTFLKTNHNVMTMKIKTPPPKTKISFLTKDIISSDIIGIPPKCILADFS